MTPENVTFLYKQRMISSKQFLAAMKDKKIDPFSKSKTLAMQ